MNDEQAKPRRFYIDLLGDPKLEIKFNMYALLQFKRLTGKNPMRQGFDINDPEDLIAITWAGIVHNPKFDGFFVNKYPDKKIQEVTMQIGKELRGEKLEEVGKEVSAAIRSAFPQKEESEEEGAEEKKG